MSDSPSNDPKSELQKRIKVLFGDLTNVAQDLLNYFNIRRRDSSHHITTSRSHHQEAIQLRFSSVGIVQVK